MYLMDEKKERVIDFSIKSRIESLNHKQVPVVENIPKIS